MTRSVLASAAALVTLALSAAPALACIGQIKVLGGPAEPGAQIQVRGYGFWADPRPVAFSWDGGTTVTTVQPDAAGVFTVALTVPGTEGSHRLVATQGDSDPEPAYNLVQVTRAGVASDAPVVTVADTPAASDARWDPVPSVAAIPATATAAGAMAIALGGLALALAVRLTRPGRVRRPRAS